VLQCVAVCCGVLQCVAVCCSVLYGAVVCCSVLQCVATCCNAFQRGGVCWTVLQCVGSVLQCVAVRYHVWQCIAVCCSDLVLAQRELLARSGLAYMQLLALRLCSLQVLLHTGILLLQLFIFQVRLLPIQTHGVKQNAV